MNTLLRFWPLMLRDFLLTRGAAMAVVFLIFGVPPLLLMEDGTSAEQRRMLGLSILQSTSIFLTLIATYGMAGQDFRSGSFRILHARPVMVPAYYLAAFSAALVGFWLVQGLAALVFLVGGVNAWSGPMQLDLTFQFLMLGSMVFCLSRLTRLGWILGLFLYQMAAPVREAYPAAESWYGAVYNVVLPPAQLLQVAGRGPGRELSALLPSGGPQWMDMAWASVYVFATLLVAVLLIRRIPLVWAR